jgi:hypothetical protein
MNFKITLNFLALFITFGTYVSGQTIDKNYQLPGKGLKQHDFVYVGEWDVRKPKAQSMFVVRGGKVVWQYSIPQFTATGRIQEFDDCTMLSNGNIVYACMCAYFLFI